MPAAPEDAEDSHALRLPAADVSVPRARRSVDGWLRLRGTPGEVREQVALVLSELATNAVKHTDSRWIICGAALNRGAVRIEVHDDDTTARIPHRRTPTPERESGRGLHIVEALALCWGVTPSPVTRGNAVWAQLKR